MALGVRKPRFPLPYICTIRVKLKHFVKQGNISCLPCKQDSATLCQMLHFPEILSDVTLSRDFVRCYTFWRFCQMLHFLEMLHGVQTKKHWIRLQAALLKMRKYQQKLSPSFTNCKPVFVNNSRSVVERFSGSLLRWEKALLKIPAIKILTQTGAAFVSQFVISATLHTSLMPFLFQWNRVHKVINVVKNIVTVICFTNTDNLLCLQCKVCVSAPKGQSAYRSIKY